MAEVVESTGPRTRTIEREVSDLRFDEPLIRTYTTTAAPRQVPARALGGAVLTWLAAVYGLCYLVLPLVASALGLHTLFLGNLVLNTIAFVPVALLAAGLAVSVRPDVVISPRAPRDPVLAAVLGNLLVWFGAHESFFVLQSITGMWIGEAMAFLTMNVVEATLVGMMLANFARTPARAFALGAAFQTLLISLFIGWL